jgi:hypothetical protein
MAALLLPPLLLLAQAADARPAKRSAHPPAHASARPASKAPGGAMDSGDPGGWISVLEAGGLKAQAARREADSVLVTAASPQANFSVQFVQCQPGGKGCKAALFDSLAVGSPSLAQLNDYNQASALCRGYMDRSGKAHVTMPLLLFADDSRSHVVTALSAWAGCVGDFAAFTKNPVAYLAAAP